MGSSVYIQDLSIKTMGLSLAPSSRLLTYSSTGLGRYQLANLPDRYGSPDTTGGFEPFINRTGVLELVKPGLGVGDRFDQSGLRAAHII